MSKGYSYLLISTTDLLVLAPNEMHSICWRINPIDYPQKEPKDDNPLVCETYLFGA